MGSPGGVPRSGMQMTAWGIEFLGWNAKWVVGYRGTSELMLALERGEIDMTATANLFLIQKLLESGRFKILVQTGTLKNGTFVSRPDFGDAPTLAKLLEGKIKDPLARQSLRVLGQHCVDGQMAGAAAQSRRRRWSTSTATPMAEWCRIRNSSNAARRPATTSEPMSSGEVETLITALANMTPEAIDHISAMLRKQGLPTE